MNGLKMEREDGTSPYRNMTKLELFAFIDTKGVW